jgi:hypothetical protein
LVEVGEYFGGVVLRIRYETKIYFHNLLIVGVALIFLLNILDWYFKLETIHIVLFTIIGVLIIGSIGKNP